jgi:hypothetical protein
MVDIITDPQNVTGMVTFLQWLNYLTNDLFGIVFLAMMLLVLFFAMKSFDTERALASSAFITALIGILFGVIGIVSDTIVIVCVLGAVVSLAGVIWSNSE